MEKNKTTKMTFNNKKFVALVLAVVLIIGATIGGTLAWLTATTEDVKNTFVVGNIGQLTLTETTTGTGTDGAYLIVPGCNIKKDPVVEYTPTTGVEGEEAVDVFVFLKVTAEGWDNTSGTYAFKSHGTNDKGISVEHANAISWSIGTDWTQLDNGTNENVYYKALGKGDSLEASAIATDTIQVSSEITSCEMQSINDAINTVTFTAYVIQQEDGGDDNGGKFTPAEAWSAATT